MGVDEGRDLLAGIGGNLPLDTGEIRPRPGDRLAEAPDLLLDVRLRELVLGHLHQSAGHDVDLADGDALRSADAVK